MRRLATAAFSFAAGIFLAQYFLPAKWQLPIGLAVAAVGLLGLLKRGRVRRRILLIAFGLALALLYDAAYTGLIQAPAEHLVGTERESEEMTLCGYPKATQYGAKVTVRLQVPDGRSVRAVYYGDTNLLELRPGNTITGDVAFSSASHIRDDDVTTFTSKGIFLLVYSRGELSVEPGSEMSPRWWPLRLARAMQEQINVLFSGDTAGFLTAILTGDKTGLSSSASNHLSQAGLYHLLAVSGMHCAFLLAMISFFTGRQRRRLTAVVAIPILLFYMLLTGGTPSVVRACIMLIFLLAASLIGRESDSVTAMAAALMVILLQNPFAAASVSLQLSFAAMAGLLWLTPKLNRAMLHGRKRNPVVRFLLFSISATLGALVFTVPLMAYYFNLLVLISPLSSILCLWAASLIFSFGLLSVLLSFVWLPLGSLLGLVPRVLIAYILWVARWLTKLPGHAVYFTTPYLGYWLAFVYGLFALAYLMKPKTRRKYVLAAGLAVVTLLATLRVGMLRYTQNALNITALNVGQGESILVSSDGAFALMDCGSGNTWYDAGELAAEAIQGMGSGTLRYLFLTHYDSDHISGVTELLDRVTVETLVIPPETDNEDLQSMVLAAAEKHGVPVEFVTEKTAYALGRATVTVYPSLEGTEDNDRGLTFLCSADDYDLLVTGDMSSGTEQKLLDTYDLPDIEALVVGHHGSRTSTSAELLQRLKPEVAIISVGSNAYGHPTSETLRRLVAAGVEIYRTDVEGDIHLSVN